MALQKGVIAFLIQNPFYLVQISHFTSTKAALGHHITSTMLDRWNQALLLFIFSLVLHLTNVLLCEPNTSNLDSSVHNTFFQSSSVQCLCNVLVLLLSCAPGPPTSLSILVRACWCCSLKGVVHTVVRNLQFLGNFLQGIAFISQNKNRLSSLRRKFSFSGHFESIIERWSWCSRYSTSSKEGQFL